MATKKTENAETNELPAGVQEAGSNSAPHPDTFDFGAFLQDSIDYPRYKATVYTDAPTAAQITELLDEKKDLTQRLSTAREEAKRESKGKAQSLAGGGENTVTELEDRIAEIDDKHRELDRVFRNSKLEFIFQHTERPSTVDTRVTAKVKAKYPDFSVSSAKDDENEEGHMERFKLYFLEVNQQVYNAAGRAANKLPDYDQLTDLIERLPTSEMNKLISAVMMTMNGGNATQRAVDAGFPG